MVYGGETGNNIPKGICDDCDEHDFDRLYNASIIHEKPLTNAFGSQYKQILKRGKVIELFQKNVKFICDESYAWL